jgi:stage III sporulation protein AH
MLKMKKFNNVFGRIKEMRIWRRNAVVAVVVLFVCMALYLSWSYNRNEVDDLLDNDVFVDIGVTDNTPVLQPMYMPDDFDDDVFISSGFFTEERINRQIARDSALTILRELSDRDSLTEEERTNANSQISMLATQALSEARIEGLVIAKGFSDCVAYINESGISVVVAPVDQGLTATDVVKIRDIVLSETSIEVANITVIEAKP